MSKQFQSKKETLSFINKSLGGKSDSTSKDELIKSWEKKYQTLAKRTKSLEKVYKFHKGVVQSISSGLITIDFDGNITFINSAALHVLDYGFQEMVGMPIKRIFADQAEAETILHGLIVKKQMCESKETNLVNRSKEIIPIGFTSTMLSASDLSFDGVIISFRDLTKLHHFRIQMERIDRLATLGEVSAGIAHEIRNPLAGIKTSAQVLEESFSPGDHRSQLIARIVKEIDRSNELLKKFFNFAKPGKPKQEFVALDSLIEGVYLLLSSKMRKKEIKLAKDYGVDIPEIYVDENQIEQVLINLFLNAIDAIDKKGEIRINLNMVTEVDLNDGKGPRDAVLLEVADNGAGIETKNLEKIFNPFFTTKAEGVGLGLSISLRLIEENGGKVNVKSTPGEGTRFSIYLPIV